MKVYCVQSSTTGVVAVAADAATACLLLRAAAETHPSYARGRVVRLGANLESLAPHQDAWHYTLADGATLDISVQTVMVLS